MVRLFGRNINNKRGKKSKRLVPRAQGSPESIRENFPLYQYALNEYSQTVLPQTSNDDGCGDPNNERILMRNTAVSSSPMPPSELPSSRSLGNPMGSGATTSASTAAAPPPTASSATFSSLDSAATPPKTNDVETGTPSPYLPMPNNSSAAPTTIVFYEEHYGPAYTGAPLKYVYPNGYQSMRPRGCPWKLSIVVCILFTWLSIFIIGHCSEHYYEANNNNNNFSNDDLEVAIEMRWCGSRPLYVMWVCSMWITGLATAYCGVIGYIKVRDFSVANARSQPPGIDVQQSDYYLSSSTRHRAGAASSGSNSIYQADGNPQFWGMHISRPTQAAVAVTSR